MRLPRDVSGVELARRLERLGYRVTRQSGTVKPADGVVREFSAYSALFDGKPLAVGESVAVVPGVKLTRRY